MNRETWKAARTIAEAALDLSGDARRRLIEERCGEDEELLAAVRMLVGEESDGHSTFLTPPDPDTVKERFSSTLFRERIGPYRIRRILGQGGMGTVFEAEQENPRRIVALKTMNPGRSSPTALRRFRVEAEALARLRHPGIAQIYEAGTLEEESQAPLLFFAMEYVEDATTLLEYAQRNELSRTGRLRLFVQVCAAVQHGHEKGVIHRDIKPGNILVNGAGHPKLIDYGVARSRDADPELRTTDEERSHIVGTLLYMSPEQLAGEGADLDVRTDVYALGVSLYELLLGRTPHVLRSSSIPEALRKLTQDPPASPRSVQSDFPNELSAILLKALSPDPAMRYPSPLELAADIRRFLSFEPVQAASASGFYRLRKFVRRHRVAVGSAVLAFASLVFLLVFITLSLEREKALRKTADEEKNRAIREEQRVQFVSDFLLDMFARVDPSGEGGLEVRMVDVLDEAAASIDQELSQDSDLEYQVRWALGEAYKQIHEFEGAVEMFSRCHELVGQFDPEPPGERHYLRIGLAMNLRNLGRLDEAEKYARLALDDAAEDSLSATEARAQLAFATFEKGKVAEAEEIMETVLDWYRERGEESSPVLANTFNSMAAIKLREGKLDEAEELARGSLAVTRKAYGDKSWRTTSACNTMAAILNRRGKYDEARPLYEEALRVRSEILGRNHYLTLVSQNNLASLLMEAENENKDLEKAEELLLDLDRRLEGQDKIPPGLLAGLNNLGWLLVEQQRLADGVKVFGKLVALADRSSDETFWRKGFFLRGYGVALFQNGQIEEAEAALKRGYDILLETVGPADRHTRRVANTLEQLYRQTDRPRLAAEWKAKQR